MTGSRPLRLLLLTPNFENNSLGRTQCLWTLGKHLGWDVRVGGVKGAHLWEPLAGSAFADDCVLPATAAAGSRPQLERLTRWCDLVLAVKPLPTSFGVGLDVSSRLDRPLLLDIDDPDLEVRTVWRPARERWPRALLSGRYRALRRLGRLTRTVPRLVSNPELQRAYGGALVPHARPTQPAGSYSSTRAPVVRFVGSPRGHKGIDVLRGAVAHLAADGYVLEVTASAPADPQPWERWLGPTTMDRGQLLVASADVIAVPSLAESWARGQLPAKLIDAMAWGRATVASDVGPIRWALADTGLLVPPGGVGELARALGRLADPGERRRLGELARHRAASTFSVEAVAPVLAEEAASAIRLWRSGRRDSGFTGSASGGSGSPGSARTGAAR